MRWPSPAGGIASVASPWNLVAFVAARGIAAVALYRSFDRALIVTSVLSVAGAIAATLAHGAAGPRWPWR